MPPAAVLQNLVDAIEHTRSAIAEGEQGQNYVEGQLVLGG